jgi:hypothetical protein
MASQLRIQIPEPCSEIWQNMSEVAADKRHCGACNRILTDFSQWSDAQLIDFFTHHNDKFCGRFSASQLNRNMIPTVQKKRVWLNLFVPAFLFAATLSAQQVSTETASSLQIVQQPKFQIRISGFVLLSDSLRGQGASIQISNGTDTTHTVSDANGYFALTLNAAANDTLLASVRLSGYTVQNSTILVAEGQLNYVMNVRMQEVLITESRGEIAERMEVHYMGIPAQFDEVVASNMVVGSKHIRMRHFFHRLFHPFKHKCAKH